MLKEEMHWTEFKDGTGAGKTFQEWLDDWRLTFGNLGYFMGGWNGNEKKTIANAAEIIALPVRVWFRQK